MTTATPSSRAIAGLAHLTGDLDPLDIAGDAALASFATVFGGPGNDTLKGTAGADLLFGQGGDDTIDGKAGDDLLFGGAGNDVLVGGLGNDQVFGQDGDDRMVWTAGSGSDLFEGGAGNDTAEVKGGDAAETFTITANGARVRLDGVGPDAFALDIGTTETVVLQAGGGDDTIVAGNGLATLVQLTLDGGAGNDTITGGDGNDLLLGGSGNDTVAGGRGNDVALLGSGDDVFVWNPGDGSDIVEGQGGTDTLVFNGSNVGEAMALSANGGRAVLTRNVANITMDLNGIERVELSARGGADTIAIGDLAGTNVKQVAIDLSGIAGTGVGDAQSDSVTVDATAGNNHVGITADASGSILVAGVPAEVSIGGADGFDALRVNGLAGNDTIEASTLTAGLIGLTLDGGDGDDRIIGSRGADVLVGGAGDDSVTGGVGNDLAILGDGNDTFVWNPGDGSDTVEGGAGDDTLVFDGSNAGEAISLVSNGSRALLLRDVAAIQMDLNGMEVVRLATAGGADSVIVGDLGATDVKRVAIDLAATGTATGDGAADRVSVIGTAGDDVITVTRSGGTISVNGLAAQTTLVHADGALDTLTLEGLGGNDTIDASALKPGLVNLALNGGDGTDTLIGSAGRDVVTGGRGNDVAMLGAGDDTFVWNPGDGSDVIDGQAGFDTLVFNGANVGETIDISADAGAARLFRNVANVTMDLKGIERVQVAALGGQDTLAVHDLAGTGVQQVAIDLGASGGAGADNQADTVVIDGTDGADVISVTSANGIVTISGLAATVTIANFDPTDRLVINGLGGDDVIDASGLGTAMLFIADGGVGDDVLIGSAGPDTLLGGIGDDILLGGAGLDVLDGGPGNNIVLQDGAALAGDLLASMVGFAVGPAHAAALAALTDPGLAAPAGWNVLGPHEAALAIVGPQNLSLL